MPSINKKVLILSSIIIFLIIGGFFFWSNGSKGKDASAAGEGWMSGWTNRKQITITNNGSLLYGTFSGSPQFSSSIKFNGSMYFNGSSYVSFADSDDWDFPGAFTIDTWVRPTVDGLYYLTGSNPGSSQPAVSKPSWYLYISTTSNTVEFGWTNGYASWPVSVSAAATLDPNNLYHIAITRDDSSNIRVFVNGTQAGSTVVNSTSITNVASLGVGGVSNSSALYGTGYMDELRISKGIARWIANFTPPTAAYAFDSYTKLLLHFDETSGTIVSSDTGATTNYQVKIDTSSSLYDETGLLGSWHMNEASGTNVADTSGNSNNGTASGTTVVAGKFGNARTFNGSTDVINLANAVSLSPGSGSFTTESWFKTTTTGVAQYIYWDSVDATNAPSVQFGVGADNKLFCLFRDVSSNQASVSGTGAVVTDGNWHHGSCVRDGTTVRLYLDGAQVATNINASLGTIDTSTGRIPRIGGASTGSDVLSATFSGTLDEVRVYSRALSASEIATQYTATKVRPDYGDVRFTSSDGTTSLSYWMERDGLFWVKIPSINFGSNTAYLYYGNSSASTLSSGDSTFDFFDDFTGTSVDSTKWTVNNGVSAPSNGTVTIRDGNTENAGLVSKWTMSDPRSYKIRTNIKNIAGTGSFPTERLYFGFWNNDFSNCATACLFYSQTYYNATPIKQLYSKYGSNYVVYSGMAIDTWYTIDQSLDSSYISTVSIPATSTTVTGGTLSSSYNNIVLGGTYVSGVVDWILARKYASAEAISVFGAEETSPPFLTQVTPVATPTTDVTPTYVFTSDKVGTITYGGDCSSATTAAIVGTNTVTFNTLAAGTHNNCTIAVGTSNVLNVPSFTIVTFATYTSPNMSCTLTTDACTGTNQVIVFKMYDPTGNHAELASQSNYSYKVCCTGAGLSNSCSGTYKDTVLKLSGATNAHAEKKTLSNYTGNDVCLSSSTTGVTCGYSTSTSCSDLGTDYVCLASISGDTNAHVAECASSLYTTKACCKVATLVDPCTSKVTSNKFISAKDTDIQLCSGADVTNTSDPCYSVCWKGTGTPNVTSANWVCGVCHNSSNVAVACTAANSTFNWVMPTGYTNPTNYTLVGTSTLTSANPIVRFKTQDSSRKVTLTTSNYGVTCSSSTTVQLMPKWKEITPFK